MVSALKDVIYCMISGDCVYVIHCHTSKTSEIRGNKGYLTKFKNPTAISEGVLDLPFKPNV